MNAFHTGCVFGGLMGLVIGEILTNRNLALLNISIVFGLALSFLIKYVVFALYRKIDLIDIPLFIVSSVVRLLSTAFISTIISIIMGSIKTGLLLGVIVGLMIKIN